MVLPSIVERVTSILPGLPCRTALFTASPEGAPQVYPEMLPAVTALVLARTALPLGLCVALYRRLRQEPAEAW